MARLNRDILNKHEFMHKRITAIWSKKNNTGDYIATLQQYFTYIFLYMVLRVRKEILLSHFCEIVYLALFYASMIWATGALFYYMFTKKVNYRRNLYIAIPLALFTIVLFEWLCID